MAAIRLDSLPFPARTLIFTGLVACLVFLFYTWNLKGLISERNRIQAEIGQMEMTVAEKTAVENQIQRLDQNLAQMEKRLEALKSNLPEQKETPAVLRSVQQMATSSNLKIINLTPKPVAPHSFYSEWPIQIQVQGNYDGLGLFFEKIGRATRIIDVDAISIKGSEKHEDAHQTLTASCIVTTFVLGDETPVAPDENGMHTDRSSRSSGDRQ